MATILNGRPAHLLSGERDRSTICCPICSLLGSRIQLRKVFTRLPVERDLGDERVDRSAFSGTKVVRGKIPGTSKAVAISLECDCGAHFEIVLIPDRDRVRFAYFLGGAQ